MATAFMNTGTEQHKPKRGTMAQDPFSYALRIGVRAGDTLALIKKIQAGFSYQAFEALQCELDVSSRELAEVVQIPPRTLTRRKASGRLQPDESERVLRVSRLYDRAFGLFEGDTEAARRWLSTHRKALGGCTPLEFMRSEIGAREVENLIGRLEHGIYS
ncbi:MAG: DUF2384 domain-containing protein [Phycisphaerae bacterium]|nr:DUF2384 domain-containing protein [Phycisphaerae bacterium]